MQGLTRRRRRAEPDRPSEPPGQPRGGRSQWLELALVALVAGLLGGAIVALVGWWTGWATHDRTVSASASCPVTDVAERALPSVVTISARTSSGAGTGSGVVYSVSGDAGAVIVTNEHVVHPGGQPQPGESPALHITYADGSTATGRLLGADQLSDLAVVRPAADAPDAPAIDVADSAGLRVGDPVVALGSPLGLTSTVTSGIVSATDRYVRVPGENGTAHLIGAVQTDAAINPGNSGGALVDCDSRLVGINTAGAAPPGEVGSSGLGFAIPTVVAVSILQQLADRGSVSRPDFGLSVRAVRPSLTDAAAPTRLLVEAVRNGGPGDRASLRPGDLLLSAGGTELHTPDDLVRVQLESAVGDRLPVTYVRDGEQSSTTLVVR